MPLSLAISVNGEAGKQQYQASLSIPVSEMVSQLIGNSSVADAVRVAIRVSVCVAVGHHLCRLGVGSCSAAQLALQRWRRDGRQLCACQHTISILAVSHQQAGRFTPVAECLMERDADGISTPCT